MGRTGQGTAAEVRSGGRWGGQVRGRWEDRSGADGRSGQEADERSGQWQMGRADQRDRSVGGAESAVGDRSMESRSS